MPPTFDIIVPVGRTVRTVTADGVLAIHFTTHTFAGWPYEVQTWDANLGYEANQIIIELEPL